MPLPFTMIVPSEVARVERLYDVPGGVPWWSDGSTGMTSFTFGSALTEMSLTAPVVRSATIRELDTWPVGASFAAVYSGPSDATRTGLTGTADHLTDMGARLKAMAGAYEDVDTNARTRLDRS